MYIAIGIVVVLLLVVIGLYNSLIVKKNAVDNAFFSMDVMLKKRHDLIPLLVETVKGYMQHEKELLTRLTELRQQFDSSRQSVNEKIKLENQFDALLQQVRVQVERYPTLKASDNFLKLQGAISEAEEQLAASRRFYNTAVNDYHNGIMTFPSSIIASMAGMGRKDYFSAAAEDKAVPSITIN